MQQHSTTKQRLIILEKKVAELERKVTAQEDREQALLARVDGFIDDLRRIERVQMRSFDELKAGQLEIRAGLETRMERVEHNIEALAVVAKDHKQAIEHIDVNVTTILHAIRGGPQQLHD